jgi:hypothetical protein
LVDTAAVDALVDKYEHEIGPRNGARVVARSDLVLIGIDQSVDRRRIDVALLFQHGPKRPNPHIISASSLWSPCS